MGAGLLDPQMGWQGDVYTEEEENKWSVSLELKALSSSNIIFNLAQSLCEYENIISR